MEKEAICDLFISNSEEFIEKLDIKTKEDVFKLVMNHPDIATNYIWCGLRHIIESQANG